MILRVLDFSVRQRWLVITLTMMAAAYGAWSLNKLLIDAVPDITNNQVQINTVAPSLAPLDIEKRVTFPIETALAGIKGLEYTRSLSRNGFSQVTAVFSDDTDVYFARQQISERLRELDTRLPEEAKPSLGPISTGLGEVYMWTVSFKRHGHPPGDAGLQADGNYVTPDGRRLTNDVERGAYLRTIQDWIIKPQIVTVPGIAGVDVIGGFEKQYVVEADPERLAALNLTFADLADALIKNNVSLGAGILERNGEGLAVLSTGRLESTVDIRNVVVTTRGGAPVKIKDIADVTIGREIRTGSASAGGKEAVVGTALMLIGGNSRAVAEAVDKKIKDISRSLPPDVEVRTVLNRTQLVDATVSTVAKNLSEGALLVIGVLFVLLGNIRAAFIAALVIPVAMLLTTIGMVQSHISANLMSLGALDFGLIVDGAVIIAENALRHIAEGQHSLKRPLSLEERLQAVIGSAEEMIKPSVYGQAIIILVYVPLLTFTGVEGKMFEPMALTVIIALISAFILSLTFVPAAIAIAISGRVEEKESAIVRGLKRAYEPLLLFALKKPVWPIVGSLALVILASFLFNRLGQEFIPTLDERNLAMHAMRIPSTSLTQSQAMQFKIEETIGQIPEVAMVFSKTGTAEVASDPMPPNVSDTFIILKPNDQWPNPALKKEGLIKKIEAGLQKHIGNNFEFSQPIEMRFNELLAGTRGDLAVKVYGDEFEPMLAAANKIAAILRQTNGAADVRVEQVDGLPFLEVKINKDEIARLGLSVAAVQDVIGAAMAGRDAGFIFEGDRRFPIVVRLPEAMRGDLEKLRHVPITLPADNAGRVTSIPLEQVANFVFSDGPNQASRENGKRRIIVSANVRGRDIASLVADAQAKVSQNVELPPGYYIAWGGQFENLAAAQKRLLIIVPVCLFLIFLLLYSALGSSRDAILVFSAIPLALTGGVFALWLRDMPFSISAAVGFIALSGVAVLNGLVMLTYIKQLMADGLPAQEAVRRGALTRLRPVVMTALVASLGFVPMALATSTGAEVQRPIATVVIGGLISATALTLLVLPALLMQFGSRVVASSASPARLQEAAE